MEPQSTDTKYICIIQLHPADQERRTSQDVSALLSSPCNAMNKTELELRSQNTHDRSLSNRPFVNKPSQQMRPTVVFSVSFKGRYWLILAICSASAAAMSELGEQLRIQLLKYLSAPRCCGSLEQYIGFDFLLSFLKAKCEFTYSFMSQHIFIKHLLCANHAGKHRGCRGEGNRPSSCSRGP